jgi:hypothetical protein
LAKPALNFPDGPWVSLLEKAYRLFDAVAADGFTIPRWSLGGGTVLMFHYAHRKSKDIVFLFQILSFSAISTLELVAAVMMITDSASIRDVILFPHMRAES